MSFLEFDIQSIAAYAVGILLFFLLGVVGARRVGQWVRKNLARRKHDLDLVQMRKEWARIEKLVRTRGEETDRLAIIEADKLLDKVLKAMHMPGESFAFRIKFAQKKYYELKQVRWAHTLRNKIVHETDVKLSRKKAKAAIKTYERALKLLGAL